MCFARESANIVQADDRAGQRAGARTRDRPGHLGETGDNVGEMDATVDGASIQIAFNVKYLIDFLFRRQRRPGRPGSDDSFQPRQVHAGG